MNTIKQNKKSFSPNNIKSSENNNKNSLSNSSTSKKLSKCKTENLLSKEIEKEKKNIEKIKKIKNEFEKKAYKEFKERYSNDVNFYNIKVINEIICNDNTHIVAEFKDYLIKGDYSEFIQKYYLIEESIDCLPKIFEYYDSCSVIFPNYVILPESKYIYKNIQRKQRVIDQQQEIEDKKEKKFIEGIDDNNSFSDIVFNDNAIDSILNQIDTSGVKKFFGLNNDNSNTFNLDNIVKIIENAEKEKKNSLEKKYNNTSLYKNRTLNNKISLNNNNNFKGRNFKRYFNEGLSNSNTMKNTNSNKNNFLNSSNRNNLSIKLNNINNTNHSKVSSTVFYIDQKYNNNTIYISSPSQIKNNKSLIRNSIIPNKTKNNNNIPIKTINEKNLIEKRKISKTKAISPKSKSLLNKNNNNNSKSINKKILSSSSTEKNLKISSYKEKKNSIPKVKHKKINSQQNINSFKQIPLTSREKRNSINPEIMQMIGAKIYKSKNLSINRKFSMSSSSNKKTFFTSTSNTCSYNNKSNNHSKKKKNNIQSVNYNNKFISVTHRNYRPPISINNNNGINYINNNIIRNKINISKTEKNNIEGKKINNILSPRKSSDFDNLLKTYEHYPSKSIINEKEFENSNNIKRNRRKISNNIIPKQKNKSIKGIQIKGFDEIIKKSRNINSISERMPSNNSIISKTNLTNNNYVQILSYNKKLNK